MEHPGRTPGTARLVLTPLSWWVVGLGVLAAFVVRNVAVQARRPLGWALFALVLAAAIENPVETLSRRMRRPVALLLVALPVLAFIGLVTNGVIRDLDRQVSRLRRDIPDAARQLERSPRFGSTARRLDLSARADKLADDLRTPSSRVGKKAAGRAGGWFVVAILTVFALGWAPRFADAALGQLPAGERRDTVARLAGRALARTQFYVDVAVLQAGVVGFLAWVAFNLAGVPAPTVLALLVAVTSLVPGVGVILGVLPAALLEATLDTAPAGLLLFVLAVAVQMLQTMAFRRWVIREVHVGPSVVIIGFILGMDVYGLAGAVVGAVGAVFTLAVLDAIGVERERAAGRLAPPRPTRAPRRWFSASRSRQVREAAGEV